MSGGIYQEFNLKLVNEEDLWNLLSIAKETKCVSGCGFNVNLITF